MLLIETLWQNVRVLSTKLLKEMTYKEYAQAEAIARLQYGASPREEAYKSVGLSKERMDKLYRAQAASELECF